MRDRAPADAVGRRPVDPEQLAATGRHQRAQSELLRAKTTSLHARAAETIRSARAALAEQAAAWLARYGRRDASGMTVTHCAWCGRIRTTDGDRWRPSTAWRSGAALGVRLSHGICPECEARHFPPQPEERR